MADRAKPEASSVELTIQAASIDTANETRDKDLRGADFFDVEKYPTITFKSTRITAKGKDAYDVTGTLTMRGVSKEITLPVSFLGFMKNQRGTRHGRLRNRGDAEPQGLRDHVEPHAGRRRRAPGRRGRRLHQPRGPEGGIRTAPPAYRA